MLTGQARQQVSSTGAVPAVTISDKAFRADQLYFSNTLAVCSWLYGTQHMLQQHKQFGQHDSDCLSCEPHALMLFAITYQQQHSDFNFRLSHAHMLLLALGWN